MEMVYGPDFLPAPTILEQGKYKGYEYYIVNIGTHPCCYVEIPVEREVFRHRKIGTFHIPCHGGITYSGHLEQLGIETSKLFIGWDYAHAFDYTGLLMTMPALSSFWERHKWTTEELIQECKEVIDYLAGLEQGYAEVGAGVERNSQNEKE